MLDDQLVHEQVSIHETKVDDDDFYFGGDSNLESFPAPNLTTSATETETTLRHFIRNLAKEKARNMPTWLREGIGWGGFMSIIVGFLTVQIYLNGILSGFANQFALGLSGVLEIALLWLWDLYWY